MQVEPERHATLRQAVRAVATTRGPRGFYLGLAPRWGPTLLNQRTATYFESTSFSGWSGEPFLPLLRGPFSKACSPKSDCLEAWGSLFWRRADLARGPRSVFGKRRFKKVRLLSVLFFLLKINLFRTKNGFIVWRKDSGRFGTPTPNASTLEGYAARPSCKLLRLHLVPVAL